MKKFLFVCFIISVFVLMGFSSDKKNKETVKNPLLVDSVRPVKESSFVSFKSETKPVIKSFANSKNNSDIDMSKISKIESANNPNAISKAGARGQYQIMKPTWNECIKLMKVDWNYDSCWNNPEKNKAVGDFYMNKRIPQLLKSFDIPVNQETKLACYNGGIGTVRNAFKKDSNNWKNHIPTETKNYIKKYAN